MIPLSLTQSFVLLLLFGHCPSVFQGSFQVIPFWLLHHAWGPIQKYLPKILSAFLSDVSAAACAGFGHSGSISSHSLSERRFSSTLKSHQPKLGSVGYREYSGKILPWQRDWGSGFGFSFPGTNPEVTTGQHLVLLQLHELPPVHSSHGFEPWSWAIKPTANGGLPVSEGKTFSASSGTVQGSCRQWQITSLGEAMCNSISRHEKQAGLLIWKTIASRHPQENQQLFLSISMDGEGHEWVLSGFIWCDQTVCRRCWLCTNENSSALKYEPERQTISGAHFGGANVWKQP